MKMTAQIVGTFASMFLLAIGPWALAQEKEKKEETSRSKPAAVEMDPVVVTATRTEEPLSQTTESVSVVTAKDRDESEQYFIPRLIDNAPGVFVSPTGGPGQLTTLSVRGAGSQHVQFQYNGLPLRDAADTQGTMHYFIEDLYSGSNLSRVEILRGPQSTLYGSQAMAGVINIIPDKWKKGFGAELRNEVGSHNTLIENGRVFYGNERLYLDIDPLYVHTDGEKNGGEHGFGYDNRGFTGSAGVKPRENMTLEFSSIYYDSDVVLSQNSPSLDANGNLVKPLADKDQHREGLLAQYGGTFTHKVSPLWDYAVKGSYGQTERHYFWSAVPGNRSNYDGTTNYLETQHNLHLADWFSLLLGADYDKACYNGREPRNPNAGNFDSVSFDQDWYSWDGFAQGSFSFLDDSLLLNAGGRYNDHQVFGSKTVGDVSGAYIVKPWGTKFHSHVGTGYRTPSLYEVYGGYLFMGNLITIGNPDLQPEESTGYDAGIEQEFLGRKIVMGLAWFRIDFSDLIIYDTILNKYNNASEATTKGIETYLDLSPRKWIKLSAAYTYTDSQYKNGDEWLRKENLPRNKVSATATFIPVDRLAASVRLTWRDENIVPLYDPAFNNVRWVESSAATVDASLSYRFPKYVEVWLRAANLLDKHYSEGGFPMPGRWLYAGLKFTY